MSSYTVYDHDLDDAELWAVIDSAAAVHSSASRSRKSTALRTPTFSPPAPAANSHSNPPRKRIAAAGDEDGRACSDGEVLQEEPWRHSPLIKQSRIYSGRDGSDNQIVLLRRGVGSGPPTTPAAAAPSYSSSPVCNNFASPVVESPTAHSLSGRFPSVNLFKQYQNAAMAILERTDYTLIHGQPFIKKSGWRKIAFYFNLSFEIKDKTIEFDENRNVQRAEFVVRAYMHATYITVRGGRFSDGWGSCERREKRFMKPNHDIPSTAETRAKNKACQDLLGIGEYRHSSGDVNR